MLNDNIEVALGETKVAMQSGRANATDVYSATCAAPATKDATVPI